MAFEFRLLPLLHFDDSSSCNLLVITGRGLHSSGKESKLKKVLSSLGRVENDTYWQKVDNNEGAKYVLWWDKKK